MVTEFAQEAGATPADVAAIRLAVSEAITNVVVHAYSEDIEPGQVEIEAKLEGDDLYVTVLDVGHGLNAASTSPGLGLGLAIISQESDSVDINGRAGTGLSIRMRFALGRRTR